MEKEYLTQKNRRNTHSIFFLQKYQVDYRVLRGCSTSLIKKEKRIPCRTPLIKIYNKKKLFVIHFLF